MNPDDEIKALKMKRDDLESQLLVVGISEQKEHDIQQRIIAIDQQITGWIGRLPPVAPPVVSTKLLRLEELLCADDAEDCFDVASHGTDAMNFRQKILKEEPMWEGTACVVLESRTSMSLERKKALLHAGQSVGAHILPRGTGHQGNIAEVVLTGPKDVNTARNGIVMCKPLEVAYDAKMWCFAPCFEKSIPGCRAYRFMLEPSLRGNKETLCDPSRRDTRGNGSEEYRYPETWSDLENVVVQLPSVVSNTALAYHASRCCARWKQPFEIDDFRKRAPLNKGEKDSPELKRWSESVIPPEAQLETTEPQCCEKCKGTSGLSMCGGTLYCKTHFPKDGAHVCAQCGGDKCLETHRLYCTSCHKKRQTK